MTVLITVLLAVLIIVLTTVLITVLIAVLITMFGHLRDVQPPSGSCLSVGWWLVFLGKGFSLSASKASTRKP